MAKSTMYELRKKQTVYAATDLPGVPKGTRGRVLLPGGITWARYRVRFDNGVELGLLDRAQLSLTAD
jgi:hypothetical protein